MSPGKAKRRILAALCRSPVLSILQTENLQRKKTVGLTGGDYLQKCADRHASYRERSLTASLTIFLQKKWSGKEDSDHAGGGVRE